jgi:hypothetical protein
MLVASSILVWLEEHLPTASMKNRHELEGAFESFSYFSKFFWMERRAHRCKVLRETCQIFNYRRVTSFAYAVVP